MSGLATLIDALGGFAGGIAPSVRNYMQNSASSSAVGDALSSLYGGGGSPSSQPGSSDSGSLMPLIMPSSGQSNGMQGQTQPPLGQGQPQPPLGQGPLASILAAQNAQGPAQPATAQTGAQSGATGGQMGPPQAPNTYQGPALNPPGGQPQQSAQPQAAGPANPQVASLGRGPLTLENLVQAIKMRHPGISGKDMFNAVQKSIPLLNMAGLQQYRGIEAQLRMESLRSLEADRADRSADRKTMERDRMQHQADVMAANSEKFKQSMELKVKQFQTNMDYKTARSQASDLHKAIQQKLEADRNSIMGSYTLDDSQKAKMVADVEKGAAAADKQLDEILAQKKSQGATEKGGKAPPAGEQPKLSDEQKSTLKSQAEAAIQAGKDPAWIRNKYKELTGEDLGQ